ncbi:MAG: adenylyl-sulfate kinase [Acidimicrobiaceae bacterium]|nr:adenylyl-sulfate kinase [Acidimicrobiaceae bacterium]MDE0516772.1 adenylyl-sulfate kinase [Acidimicrobiaceae bacterium]MDE0656225.1 adenylyl-sulfate kinase [Acidimicrobiaceae bacterium]MXZ96917.1 adenylyl-sulfate kinase [Acidimicrobiaceae bacterium]MYF42931.1 adenylyl-sulfate kinase [Acidimicrobiaceae bacterium]
MAPAEAAGGGPGPRHDLLRLLTCGSVDDGKSTLIGRLLHDSDLLYDDHLAAVRKDSAVSGHAGGQVDLALLADGLKAEREQGITIDVAHLYFSTSRRSFIIADAPGHEQYTRNMATGASTADLAVILVDAAKGVTTQTRRHSAIVSLLGIKAVVMAINKMDLVGYAEDRFDAIAAEASGLAGALGLPAPVCIPMSALHGDCIVEQGASMGWYDGPCLMEHLEQVDVGRAAGPAGAPEHVDALRLPVQLVIRPDQSFRGYAGTVCSGMLRPGDDVRVEPSGLITTVERIVTFDGDLDEAGPGRAVTVTTADPIDIGRGDILCSPDRPPERAREFTATLVWMSESDLVLGRDYQLQQAGQRLRCRVTEPVRRLDVDTLTSAPAPAMRLNDIASVTLRTDAELMFDPYEQNRTCGSFILIDPSDNATVAAGMIKAATRAAHIVPSAGRVSPQTRAQLLGHRALTVWFTGLPGSGKSTLARAAEAELAAAGVFACVLDGDNLRFGLNADLGFAPEDRAENIRRAGEVAALLHRYGAVVLAAFISPYRQDRDRVRNLHPAGTFMEVFVDAPLDVCEARDPKGLYAKARAGTISDLTGVSAPYEAPAEAEMRVRTAETDVSEASAEIVAEVLRRVREPGGGTSGPH